MCPLRSEAKVRSQPMFRLVQEVSELKCSSSRCVVFRGRGSVLSFAPAKQGRGGCRLGPGSTITLERRPSRGQNKRQRFYPKGFFRARKRTQNLKLLILNLKKHSGRQFTKGSHKIKSARPSEMMFRALLVLALGLASCADVDSPTKPAAPKSPEDAMRGTPTTPTRPDAAESTPCARQQPRSPCASVKHPNRRDARMRISAVIVCVR